MTLIGAFKCMGDVVLFADRQETISDYAKWDTDKIGYFQTGNFRFLGAAAGDGDVIDMIWEEVFKACKTKQHAEIKQTIISMVARITKKSIIPFPSKDRPWVDFVWAIQGLDPSTWGTGVELFRTSRLNVNTIGSHYFTGSPVLLTKYLSDLYLVKAIIGTDEAEALAAYILWEAKEYDPSCGKHSDIITLRHDGRISRTSLAEIKYWEEHFQHFKHSIRILPLLTCITSTVMQKVYDEKDHLSRLVTSLKTLAKEQRAMRKSNVDSKSRLERKLVANLRKAIAKYGPKPAMK